MKSLLEMIQEKGLRAVDVARKLNCDTSQIYKWNKNGISQDNPYFDELKEMFPELKSKGPNKSGRKGVKRQIKQINEDGLEIPRITQPKEVKTNPEYPKVIFKKKD